MNGQMLIVIPLIVLAALYVGWRSWRTWTAQGKGCGGGCGSGCASGKHAAAKEQKPSWIPAEQVTLRIRKR